MSSPSSSTAPAELSAAFEATTLDAAAATEKPKAKESREELTNKPRAIESVVPNYVDLQKAQQSKVAILPGLIRDDDMKEIFACHKAALDAGDPLVTNPQNKDHKSKRCIFLHGQDLPTEASLLSRAPRVLSKLLRAAVGASEGWALPLAGIDCRRLSIRVVELWEYEPGGGLVDDYHFDAGSIITIVTLVCDESDFTGGVFRTFEADGKHVEHQLKRGDVVCFLSHKYHNITPVLTGRRKSMVIELWEGGLSNWCR